MCEKGFSRKLERRKREGLKNIAKCIFVVEISKKRGVRDLLKRTKEERRLEKGG
jgi:hypothetical protein